MGVLSFSFYQEIWWGENRKEENTSTNENQSSLEGLSNSKSFEIPNLFPIEV
jgi:hypothetical protein